MKTYTIKCRVTLTGADMIVEADSIEEALKKGKAGDWEEIDHEGAEVSDIEVTGKPVED